MKRLVLILLGGTLVYSASMMILRLRITERAYDFENYKKEERSLHEEQVRLKALIETKLSESRSRVTGLRVPDPEKVHVIP